MWLQNFESSMTEASTREMAAVSQAGSAPGADDTCVQVIHIVRVC